MLPSAEDFDVIAVGSYAIKTMQFGDSSVIPSNLQSAKVDYPSSRLGQGSDLPELLMRKTQVDALQPSHSPEE